jgi:hypothetical protein
LEHWPFFEVSPPQIRKEKGEMENGIFSQLCILSGIKEEAAGAVGKKSSEKLSQGEGRLD